MLVNYNLYVQLSLSVFCFFIGIISHNISQSPILILRKDFGSFVVYPLTGLKHEQNFLSNFLPGQKFVLYKLDYISGACIYPIRPIVLMKTRPFVAIGVHKIEIEKFIDVLKDIKKKNYAFLHIDKSSTYPFCQKKAEVRYG